MLGTFTKICPGTEDLVNTKHYQAPYVKTSVVILLMAVWNIVQLNISAKGTHYCISMATLNGCILFTATCGSTTVQSEHIVAFYYGISLASTPPALPVLFFLSVCPNW